MSKLTREQAQKIIVAADEVITALAGTNEDVHPDDSKKMCELWDDLNDRHAPPVVVRELARMALAALDSEPVAEVVSIYGDPEAFGEREIRPLVGIQQMPYGTKFYRHAQPVVPDDVQRDAKRWRALLGSARIRILGSAGFDATAHPGENPDYRHFGMEIWTHYPNWLHEKNEYGIDTLTQYADAMLAAAPQEVK